MRILDMKKVKVIIFLGAAQWFCAVNWEKSREMPMGCT